ncbi:MAG: MBL fold metallo-hydrolase [Ruminococcaceae bacterium]|nr:MBL fold metallo-hydrolase [Oscillospiraceae bacterium]
MKLTFIGAAHEVTGSCHYIEVNEKRILIDCGMEQGRDEFQNCELPIVPSVIDYVFLTHAHIDHSGLLPYLAANGFRGTVFSTDATYDLCKIMLADSAHIQMFEAEWRNRKAKRSGGEKFVPLYTDKDVESILKCFSPTPYGIVADVCDGVKFRLTDAGHLLGSASVELWLTEKGETRKIVFSGDIGNVKQPILRDPQYISNADYVVTEATYGDRLHDARPDYIKELVPIIQQTFDRGGNVVVPSFAIGRTQEMLYFIRKIKQDRLVKGHDNFPVYIDSPLAIEATTIFKENYLENYDDEALSLVKSGVNPIGFPDLVTAVTADESKLINADKAPKIIISASGMCEAGRIKHHLKHNLWRKESTVLFVGYQGEGTLGRALLDGAKTVTLFSEKIKVEAQILRLPGISGHGDKDGLKAWLGAFEAKPKRVFVVHGDSDVCDSYARELENEGYSVYAPYSGAQFNLLTGNVTLDAKPQAAEKKKGKNTVLDRLVAACERLLVAAKTTKIRSDKQLAQLADKINAITDKLEK